MNSNLDAKLDQLVLLAATRAPGSAALNTVTVLALAVKADPTLADDPAQVAKLERTIARATRQLESGATSLDLTGPSIVSAVRDELASRFPGRIRGG
jgi:uncharacterized membrane protein YjjP (DUF1212 family)